MFSLLSLCIVTMPKRATVTRRESRHMSHQRIRSDPFQTSLSLEFESFHTSLSFLWLVGIMIWFDHLIYIRESLYHQIKHIPSRIPNKVTYLWWMTLWDKLSEVDRGSPHQGSFHKLMLSPSPISHETLTERAWYLSLTLLQIDENIWYAIGLLFLIVLFFNRVAQDSLELKICQKKIQICCCIQCN